MVLMYHLAKLPPKCQRNQCHHRVSVPLFSGFLLSGNSFFGRPYAKNICCIFLLSIKLNAWENSINKRETSRFGPAVRVFANGPGDLGSIPGRVIPKTLKMELDTTLLNTQHYKVRFKGKVEQSWEWSSALPYTLV